MKRIMLSLTMLLCILAGSLSLPVSGEEQTGRSKAMMEKKAFENSMQERFGKLVNQMDEQKKGVAGAEYAEEKIKE